MVWSQKGLDSFLHLVWVLVGLFLVLIYLWPSAAYFWHGLLGNSIVTLWNLSLHLRKVSSLEIIY